MPDNIIVYLFHLTDVFILINSLKDFAQNNNFSSIINLQV